MVIRCLSQNIRMCKPRRRTSLGLLWNGCFILLTSDIGRPLDMGRISGNVCLPLSVNTSSGCTRGGHPDSLLCAPKWLYELIMVASGLHHGQKSLSQETVNRSELWLLDSSFQQLETLWLILSDSLVNIRGKSERLPATKTRLNDSQTMPGRKPGNHVIKILRLDTHISGAWIKNTRPMW